MATMLMAGMLAIEWAGGHEGHDLRVSSTRTRRLLRCVQQRQRQHPALREQQAERSQDQSALPNEARSSHARKHVRQSTGGGK